MGSPDYYGFEFAFRFAWSRTVHASADPNDLHESSQRWALFCRYCTVGDIHEESSEQRPAPSVGDYSLLFSHCLIRPPGLFFALLPPPLLLKEGIMSAMMLDCHVFSIVYCTKYYLPL